MMVAPGRVFALSLLFSSALACSCGDIPFKQAIEGTDLIFAARVVGYHQHEEPLDMDVDWRMVPSAVWKGQPADTITVSSNRYGASCGFLFEVGREYLVFAQIEGKDRQVKWTGVPKGFKFPKASTSACSKTRSMVHAEEALAALGRPLQTRSPETPDEPSPHLIRVK